MEVDRLVWVEDDEVRVKALRRDGPHNATRAWHRGQVHERRICRVLWNRCVPGRHGTEGYERSPVSDASTAAFEDRLPWEWFMSSVVDFGTVSTVGLESSPVARALAGLRANEARYFKNKYDHVFTVEPASKSKKVIDYVHRI